LAISGGPDSLALLLLAHAGFPNHIAAATVDHGLRREASDEAQYVGEICRDLGVPHAILSPPSPITGNLQSQARKARYALLEDWRARENLGWIATAHHADDQLETVLMRLLRGSGIDGLSAIRPINERIVRPLLAIRKAELSAFVVARGIEAIDDPSNADPRFDRVRLRETIGDLADFDAGRLMRSTNALREASDALGWIVRREAETVVATEGDAIVLGSIGYPPEIMRRLVMLCLRRVDDGIEPRGPALDALLVSLGNGESATLGGVQCVPEPAAGKPAWRFSPAPPRNTG